jgi:peptide/nickel transport system substrate-binding protein
LGYEEHINGEADELVGVQVLDDYTVEYTLSTPNPRHFTTQYRTYFLPEHAIDFTPAEFMETDWWVNSEKQVGSGPFVMGEFVKDEYGTLEKNPLYFEGEPKLDRIVDRFFGGDITAAVLALAAGEIDFTYLEPTDIETLGEGFNIYSNNSNVPVYTDIHYRNPDVPEYWRDIRVRQAIMYAIDRPAITDQVLDGTHYPLPCPVPFPDLWHEDVNWFEYDPEMALSLLEEAGINPADIEMEWVGHAGYDNIHHNSALQAVQAYLADIGVTMTYRFVDVPTFRDRYTAEGEWTFHYRGTAMPIYGAEYGRGWSNAGSQGGDFKGFDMVEVGLEDAIAAINMAPTDEEYFDAIRNFCLLYNQALPDLTLWIGNRYGAAGENVMDFWWQPAGGGGPYKDDSHLWYIGE